MALTRLGLNQSVNLASNVTGTLPSSNLPAGSVLQVVTATKTDTASISSSTFGDISGLSISITPSSASNKILIIGDISGGMNHGQAGMSFRIKQTISSSDTFPYVGDSSGSRTQASFGAYISSDDNFMGKFSSSGLLSPNTTSAITYTYQFRSQTSDIVYLNRSVSDSDASNSYRTASSLTAMEIAG